MNSSASSQSSTSNSSSQSSSSSSSHSTQSSSRGRGGHRGGRGGRGGYRGAFSKCSPPSFKNNSFSEEARTKHEEEKKRLSEEFFSPIRGEKFNEFIAGILKECCLLPSEKVQEYLQHIDVFEQAFTSSTASSEKNYEAFEILGDLILNLCVVKYLTTRFPQLMADDGSGVSTLARLKINLISKSTFSKFAEKLKFGDYIASDMLTRRDDMPSLLEDTFEAFTGALMKVSEMCDKNSSRKGYLVGFGPQYRMISGMFDEMEISLKYEDLYDAKTRFKQLIENKGFESSVKFEQEINENGKIVFTAFIKVVKGDEVFHWKGVEFKKALAEQIACESAIADVKKM